MKNRLFLLLFLLCLFVKLTAFCQERTIPDIGDTTFCNDQNNTSFSISLPDLLPEIETESLTDVNGTGAYIDTDSREIHLSGVPAGVYDFVYEINNTIYGPITVSFTVTINEIPEVRFLGFEDGDYLTVKPSAEVDLQVTDPGVGYNIFWFIQSGQGSLSKLVGKSTLLTNLNKGDETTKVRAYTFDEGGVCMPDSIEVNIITYPERTSPNLRDTIVCVDFATNLQINLPNLVTAYETEAITNDGGTDAYIETEVRQIVVPGPLEVGEYNIAYTIENSLYSTSETVLATITVREQFSYQPEFVSTGSSTKINQYEYRFCNASTVTLQNYYTGQNPANYEELYLDIESINSQGEDQSGRVNGLSESYIIDKPGTYTVRPSSILLDMGCIAEFDSSAYKIEFDNIPFIDVGETLLLPSAGIGEFNVVAYPFDSVKWTSTFERMDPTILRPTFIIKDTSTSATNEITVYNGLCSNKAVAALNLGADVPQTGVVSGYVNVDINGNCVGDIPSQRWVEITPGPYLIKPDSSGFFEKELLFGSYDVSIDLKQDESVCEPLVQSITLDNSNVIEQVDFLVSNTIPKNDLSVFIANQSTPPRPGFNYTQRVIITNEGENSVSGNLYLFLSEYFDNTTITALPFDEEGQLGDTLIFQTPQIAPGEKIILKIAGTIDVSSLGKIMKTFAAIEIEGLAGDINENNDNEINERTIVGSYDPNDKQVSPEGEIPYKTTPRLAYHIRFQNTGTYPAYKVVIRDTLESNFNINTLELGPASHDYKFSVEPGNVLTWTFDGIMLPDRKSNEQESHGFVKFYIKPKENLPLNTVVKNDADIYFDFNEPIITNETENTILLVTGVEDFLHLNSVEVYPNPTAEILILEPKKAGIYQIVTLNGKTIQQGRFDKGESKVDLSEYHSGIYFVKFLYDDTTMEVVKVIKQ